TQGMQQILGFNYGAGHWNRVRRTHNLGEWAGVIVTTVGFAVAQLFPDEVSRMFTVDATLIALARRAFRIYFIFFPFEGCQIIIQNFFQSIGKPTYSIFLSLTRLLVFLIPLLIVFPQIWGVDGVWSAMAGSDLLAFFTAITTLVLVMRRLNRQFSKI
ncbi:MAG: MATE family efflux transporter, partial [Muribaculaceae bacterium]|nr:MATE family efflux transporter [Muribaculaceae bacterium]